MGLYQGDKPLSSIGKSPAAYAKDAGYTGTNDNFYTALANMPDHLSNQENPHGTTASQVGADVAGAANEALNSAKAYTDQIVAGVIPGDGSKESPADSDSIFIYDNADSGKPKKTLISKLVELFNNTFYTKTESDTLLQKKVNPNLLDNWYFGNPVDQRGGYIVLAGTAGYADTGLSVSTGPFPGPAPATRINDTYSSATNAVGTFYVKTSDLVRGYTGAGYGIDRWKAETAETTLLITSKGIELVRGSSGVCYVIQIFPDYFKNILGETVTASYVDENDKLHSVSFAFEGNDYKEYATDGGYNIGFAADPMRIVFANNTPNSSAFAKAAKLELGSTQTLAHQDENGNWVLNEIPDYGEQLRRCQRYFVNFNPYKMAWFAMPPAVASNTTQAYSSVTLPVAMRAQPVVSYGGNIVLSQDANHAVTSISVSDSTFTGNSIQLKYEEETGSLTANSLYRVQGGYDASAYIWLSADL